MDPGEESVTLSSFDFDSSFALYSSDSDYVDDDDDDDCTNYEEQFDRRNKDEIDAYIEIELPLASMAEAAPLPLRPSVTAQVAVASNEEEELDFRISFSAVIPFPGFSPSSMNSDNAISTKPSFSICEDASNAPLTLTAATDSSPLPAAESTLSCIHRRAISNHSPVSIFPLDWTRFPPPVDDSCRRLVSDINGWELVRSSNNKSKSSPAANGGITKLLVKLRSIVIRGLGSMRASLAQAGIGTTQAQKRCPNSRRLTSMKPMERWLTLCKPSEPQQRTTAVRTSGEMRSPSNIMEMKFEAMRKLFGGAVSPVKNNGISKSGRLNKSCPTSIKSSPVHQSGDASLVYAAIAHCKKSFAQNDDLSF